MMFANTTPARLSTTTGGSGNDTWLEPFIDACATCVNTAGSITFYFDECSTFLPEPITGAMRLKMWRDALREFLLSILPEALMKRIMLPTPVLVISTPARRLGKTQEARWKLKAWKQEHS